MSKTKAELEQEVRILRERLDKHLGATNRWEVKEEYIRDKRTGTVFWTAGDCYDCGMSRIIMYPGDGDRPEILEHCGCREHDDLRRYKVFHDHIQAHLKDGQHVVCKICGRSAKDIMEVE